jgi:4-amino-4-deoxy-L-arabinose transferase-like glycosyltransferase
MKKHWPFFIFSLALFLLISGPSTFSQGMFMDGLWYASISRNLSEGIGSFWNLAFTQTLYPEFHEHPPLAFGLQSLIFRVFGDHFLVERVYSLLMTLISASLIWAIWKQLTRNYSTAWIPIFIFFTIPVIWWSTSNNMLENTMTVFTTLAVFFMIRSLQNKRFTYLILTGVSLYLAALSKGPVAFFVITLPFWMAIRLPTYSFKKGLIDTLLLILGFLFIGGLVAVLNPESTENIWMYIEKQILGSLENPSHITPRYAILLMLANNLLNALIFIALVLFFTRKQKGLKTKNHWISILIALGFSGFFPVMITLKQSGFYILPVYPILSIALGLILYDRLLFLTQRLYEKQKTYTWIKRVSVFMLLLSVVLIFIYPSFVGREKEEIADIQHMLEEIPVNSIMGIEPENAMDWSLHGYFYRFAHISIDYKNKKKHTYTIVRKGYSSPFLNGYLKVDLPTTQFELYRLDPSDQLN